MYSKFGNSNPTALSDLSLITLCNVRSLSMLNNIPPPRYTPLSPYPQYTQFQLDLRRKVEILKYSPNIQSNQTNSATQKQLYASACNRNVTAQVAAKCLQIDTTIYPPLPSSSSGVPGPAVMLYCDPSVPLYNYQPSTNDSYSTGTIYDSLYTVAADVPVGPIVVGPIVPTGPTGPTGPVIIPPVLLPIVYVNPYLAFLPPVIDQGRAGDSQSYTVVYGIGSYYSMLQKFGINNSDIVLNDNSASFVLKKMNTDPIPNIKNMNMNMYYDISSNILNPLYTYLLNNSNSSIIDVTTPEINVNGPAWDIDTYIFSIQQSGCATLAHFDLSFNRPDISIDGSGNTIFTNYGPNLMNIISPVTDFSVPTFSQIDNLIYPFPQYTIQPTTTTSPKYIYAGNPNIGISLVHTKIALNTYGPLYWSFQTSNYFQTAFYNMSASIFGLFNNTTIFNQSSVDVSNSNIDPSGLWCANDTITMDGSGQVAILIGYIDNLPGATKADGSTGVFVFQNSYGTSFGNNGYGYITYKFFTDAVNGPTRKIAYIPIKNSM